MRNLEDAVRSLEHRTEALFYMDVAMEEVGKINIEATRLWLSHRVSDVLKVPSNMEGYARIVATDHIADFPSSLLRRLEYVISTLESAFQGFNADESQLMKADRVRINAWRDYTGDYWMGAGVSRLRDDVKLAKEAFLRQNANL